MNIENYYVFKISNTFFGGLPITALLVEKTIGLSIILGYLTIALISSLSFSTIYLILFSLKSASPFLTKSFGLLFNNLEIFSSSSFFKGVFKYSIIVGFIPWF